MNRAQLVMDHKEKGTGRIHEILEYNKESSQQPALLIVFHSKKLWLTKKYQLILTDLALPLENPKPFGRQTDE